MQYGNELNVGGTDCCKTNNGNHIVDDHCRYCGQVDVVKHLTKRLAAAEALVVEAREHDPDVYWLSKDWHKRAAK